MIEPTQWYFFLIATLALLIVPGPAVLYIVARSVNQGRLAGLVSVLGIASGTFSSCDGCSTRTFRSPGIFGSCV